LEYGRKGNGRRSLGGGDGITPLLYGQKWEKCELFRQGPESHAKIPAGKHQKEVSTGGGTMNMVEEESFGRKGRKKKASGNQENLSIT